MTNDLPNLDKIEGYLNGAMPEVERKDFELKLATDPALKKEFNLVQDILLGIEQSGDEVLKGQIGGAHRELKEEGFFEKKMDNAVALTASDRVLWRRWAVAASLLIICGAALFLWLKQNNPYQNWFAKNFQVEDSKTAILIDDLSASGLLAPDRGRRDSLAEALKLYQLENYKGAQQALIRHRRQHLHDTIAQFYLGISELHLSNFDKAIALLQPIAPEVLKPGSNTAQVSRGIDFQHEITWYLALAYSRRPGQLAKDSTLLLLRRLKSGDNSFYSAKARAALQQLE